MLIIRKINKPGFAVTFTTGSKGWRSGESVSHQCGPGSNPGVDAICGLSLLLVLSFAPRGFSPGTPVSPSPQKPTFPNSNSTINQVHEQPLCGCATSNSVFIYLYLFTYLFTTVFIVISLTEVITECAYLMLFSSNVNLQSCQTPCRGKLWPWLKMIFIMI